MMWSLPRELEIGEEKIPINADFRDIFKVLDALNDETLPQFLRWCKALKLFYKEPILPEIRQEAAQKLAQFLSCGAEGSPGRRLFCWNFDAPMIAAEINRVAGMEVRQAEFIHWWTFLGWFHAIGDGSFAQVVAIRQKLATGKKLTDTEQTFYRANRSLIRLPDTESVKQEKQALEQLLNPARIVK